MSVRLPVGVIGVGALGSHHARHLASLPGVELVGVYDLVPTRAAEVAAKVNTQPFRDLDRLLARVKAVTIAVPTPAHADVGVRALEAGVAVLMEKPLASSLDGADRLVEAAGKHNAILQVGHVERFNRAIRAAMPYLAEPRYMESMRLAPFQPRGTDVAVILDLMIHDLDLVLHLVGGVPATDVRASGVAVLSPFPDMANARVEFGNGAVANVTASRMARDRIRKLRIFETSGYFSLDLATGTGEFMRLRPDWRPSPGLKVEDIVERIVLDAPEADALRLELESFVAGVEGEHRTGVSGEEGRSALALALQVAEAVSRSPVTIAPPP
ncbi:MAG TPA: Gfo/Idh/MocA family oxidoreductase [Gemmatimonadales bacterium]|nr:Gfo/Idh/MocA family oxidoreductase [Gemmatimonadales bacterium]